jgi:NitT/TauT family transport system permease protein
MTETTSLAKKIVTDGEPAAARLTADARSGRRAKLRDALLMTGNRILFLVVWLAIWEATALWWIDPFWISQPTKIVARLWTMIVTGDMFWHSAVTIWEALLGLVLGLAVGIPCGMVLAANRLLAGVIDPFLMGIYSLPRVALAPLFIIWFGIGLISKVMMAFSLVLFIFVLNTYEGLKNVDRDLIDMLRTMRAPRSTIIRKVLLPSIVPWIFAAVRIGIGLALIGAVVGELIGSNRGLGWYVEHAAGQFDTTGVFAGLITLMVLAMIANEIVKAVEKRTLTWRREA